MAELALSVIVPIYNVEEYLDECLQSIYSLSDIDFEVILVNDGSPDESDKIITKFQALHPNNTVVINRQNGGLSAARNSGLAVAKGHYIALIDSDDYIDSSVLADLYHKAQVSTLDIAFAQSITFWGEKKSQSMTLSIPRQVIDVGVNNGVTLMETAFNCGYKRVNCWNKIYRREFIQENGLNFVEGLLFEDVPFTFETFFAASKVQAFPSNFYYYRQRPGSIMSSKNQKSDNSRIIIIQHLLDFFEKNNYQGNAFDDYLVYQLWENAYGTGQRHSKLVSQLIKRRKTSIKGFIRLASILLGLSKLMPD